MNADFNEIAGGMLKEKFEKSFNKIIKNIVDPNTDPKATRTLSIKISFKPNEERSDIEIIGKTSEKLAPEIKIATRIYLDYDIEKGIVSYEENGTELKGQTIMSLWNNINPETGEIN